MTQEEKNLLLEDICCRLPYGVKVHAKYIDTDVEVEKVGVLSMVDSDAVVAFTTDDTNCYNYVAIHEVKPYLFPISSMNEEQKNEFDARTFEIMFGEVVCKKNDGIGYRTLMAFDLDFYNKHHLDWRGLIPMGLAIDATNLNIY